MSEPKHEYGYLYNPPDAKVGDHNFIDGEWMEMVFIRPGETKSPFKSRRLIQPGEGFEIVAKEEHFPVNSTKGYEATKDGQTWFRVDDAWKGQNVGIARDGWGLHHNILAIRQPKPPVVEKEDDGYEKWYQEKGQFINISERPYRAWLASRAAVKGKDK